MSFSFVHVMKNNLKRQHMEPLEPFLLTREKRSRGDFVLFCFVVIGSFLRHIQFVFCVKKKKSINIMQAR